MTRVAAIDCGTNSIRLLVADIDLERSTLTDVDRRMEVVRLGQGVDRTGRLAPEALARTFAACDTYAEVIRGTGAERVRFVATSATRDVENRDEFVAGVRDRFGVEPEVVTGDTEARAVVRRRDPRAGGQRAAAPVPRRRHRRRLDRARAGRARCRAEGGAVGRRRAACG